MTNELELMAMGVVPYPSEKLSGVNRYMFFAYMDDDVAEIDCHESEDGGWVGASDYDALEAERDELREQVEAMRALMAEAVPALQHLSDTAQNIESFTPAERFRLALQAKP